MTIRNDFSFKVQVGFKSTLLSIQHRKITESHRSHAEPENFTKIIIHFSLESKSARQFGALLPEQQNRQHQLKWFQIQTVAEKFSFTLYILRVLNLQRKLPNVGKVHPECPVKRISGQDHFFRFKLPFEQQSFISGVDEYVQILRLAIELQQMCNSDSLHCVQNQIKIIVVRKIVLCCSGIQIENIRCAEAIRWGKVKQGRNVPEGENNDQRRQRCAKSTFLGQNRKQVSQRRINAKCELWGWSYARISCNPAFLNNHAQMYTFCLNSLSHFARCSLGCISRPQVLSLT
ncbi:Hypothetical_protein [Hexamita inflata]|uniref:Hypothetical_protein n=1 Tax=Hexamita inflata TaxID=28002 RepID=A0AA86U8N3_9EUKA|nr:Hypothetical protein HINF_LOCUS10605 [Hexamita inflata]CAI9929154.1 Hypothetical protein HINF_LOCUS16799 [Hexamita inflata]CAI9933598.1 Hypothetical protein HINF_LOCUS21243 [Hexamita inflata]CAI9940896.1 Hypothetical protein HINF_LOCUS28541 [Hexamita inflata]